MRSGRVTVLLPCHTLDDFPTWLEEADADDLLAAWTAAWHPALIAAAGEPPSWASVDLPPPNDSQAGIVPGFCAERFEAQADPDAAGRWIVHSGDAAAVTAEVAGRLGLDVGDSGELAAAARAAAFEALGLATLLAELLARRMRTEADLDSTGFDAAVVTAARAAVADDAVALETALAEAYACLEATRARYYSVESWAIDTVLLASSTLGTPLVAELESPVPLAVVADGATIRELAGRHPASLAALREAVTAGRVEPCGGRDDQTPLDLCLPEAIRDSFVRGRAAWCDAVGRPPSCYGCIGGGSSALLPQMLAGFGYSAALWSLFDGTPQLDAGGGLIRWEGTGGGAVEAIARPPLDARSARTVLELPDRIGDALDHDHVAVIQFASYAGTCSRWHRVIRTIGDRSSLLGTFVTPSRLAEATAGGGTPVSFEPDAFAVSQPPEPGSGDVLPSLVRLARGQAEPLVTADRAVARLVAGGPAGQRAVSPSHATATLGRVWLPGGFFGRRRDDDTLVLDNDLVQLRPHPRTGGLLSLRRPADRGNRISQQLALRTTAEPTGSRWETPEERAEYTRMEADAITRSGSASDGRIESRGRLVAADGRARGRFVQRMTLVPDRPLALLDLEVELDEPVGGPLFENHVACRFAWHENEDVELRRSLHLQSIITERTRFTAPHFIEVGAAAAAGVSILTGGLPWHLRSSPHVLDSVLLSVGKSVACRLAVGIGLEQPWDTALALAAGGPPAVGPRVPANVRCTVDPAHADDPPETYRVSLVESAGRRGEVRIEWAREVGRVVAVDFEGRPLPDVSVAVAGRTTTVPLERYEWLRLVLEFTGGPPDHLPRGAAS
jgi:hypothetical protein